MKTAFPMPVLNTRGGRFPASAIAFALVEGKVRLPALPKAAMHIVAFRGASFVGMTVAKEDGSFVLQLPPGRYQLRAFDRGRELAAASLDAPLGVHTVELSADARDPDTEYTLEVDGRDDAPEAAAERPDDDGSLKN